MVAEAIQTLIDQRLLSETRAVAAIVASKSGKRAIGREALREELLKKGLDDSQLAVADRSDEDERAIMLSLIEKLDDRGRAARLLARRGFDEELIGSVLDQRYGEAD